MKKQTAAGMVDESGTASLDPKNAAVALPVGSFDIDKLGKHLDAATEAELHERDAKVQHAFKQAKHDGTTLDATDGSIQPGDVVVDVKHPELDVTESIRVSDPKAGEQDAAAAPGNTKE